MSTQQNCVPAPTIRRIRIDPSRAAARSSSSSTIDPRHRVGVENVMLEVDFPHGDTTWPDTQRVIEEHWGHIPEEELRLMTHANAAKLFRHPLPEVTRP